MKKITLLSIFVCAFLTLLAQSLTVSYVNGYKILKGERPAINVRDFPVEAYEQGKMIIKIDRSYEMQLPDMVYLADTKGYVRTGIARLDHLNAQFKATSYSPLFGTLYETNSRAQHYRERHRAWEFHLWFTIELDENVSIADAVEAYQTLPFVEVAEPLYKIVLYDADKMEKWSPNDPMLENQWHYNNTGQSNGTPGCDISLFNAWEIEKGNSDVIVSVVDCGINANHPDLQANMWSEIGYNFYQSTSTIYPGDHGCHTGGTISAVNNNGNGVAGVAGGSGSGDGVRLMTCQIFPPDGQGGGGQQNAYIYAADNGACISQNSWGYTSPNSYNQAVLNAIDYFIANGGGEVMQDGIVIFASGNGIYSGSEGNYYPGCYAPVLGVTATTNQDKKAYYAHYGTWVGISAPGGETNYTATRGVLSCTTNSYNYFQGTSMACPHVSGAAALLVSYAARLGYKLSRLEIINLLKDNADNHYAVNPSYVGKLGTGRLNAYKALLALPHIMVVVDKPENVIASPLSQAEIEINWQKNESNDEVILFANTTNEFGKPKNGSEYQIGDLLTEGGQVIYRGDAETFLHSELDANTTYYYKLFSYSENIDYSDGITCEATTLCSHLVDTFFEDFEKGDIICLEQENLTGNLLWVVGTGNDSGFPEKAYEGAYNVYLTLRNGSHLGNRTRLILTPVKMTDFNNVQLSFALYNQVRSGNTDELNLYYKTFESETWTFWKNYNNNQDTWLLDTIILPENVKTDELQICFEGKINAGYGICLDNIAVERFISTVGVVNHNLDSKITLYPNPTNGELRIMNYELKMGDIQIFDVYGKSVALNLHAFQNHSEAILNVSHLPAGVYIIKIADNFTGKIIKN
ncbi:MAG: S8 family serine peptidase [Lentimicrobiaceae bacterium]|nr:S8 family serine peptidase [Lentimicrobiaceae bacterium]